MKVVKGENSNEFILEFSSADEFEEFFQKADQDQSFLIPHPEIPKDALLRATAGLRMRRIRPVRIVREEGSTRVIIAETQHESESSAEETRPAAKTVAEKIRELTVTEKAMLAMRANFAERRVLMQDTNPKVQEFLLRNPQITEREIAWLAKNPLSAIPTLLTIIEHKNWMNADSIRHGVLTNPKTPAHIILDKIPGLSAGDLIKMHHAKNLREDVRFAVDRQIKRRGINIRPL